MPSVIAARLVRVLPPSGCSDLLMPVLWTMAAGWVRTPVLFFGFYGPKYTELSLPVRECLLFATLFSDWRYLVAFGRYSRSSREVVRNRATIWRFGAAKFRGKGPLNVWANLKNLGHRRPCSKVWWRLAKRPRKLGGKKDQNYSGKT